MVGRMKAEPIGQLVYRPFELGVAERDEPAAAVAQQMVVVLAGRIGRLVSGGPVAKVEPVHECVLVEQLEHPVDARPANRAPALAPASQCILDLQRAERAVLPREKLDQLVARGAAVMARSLEHLTRMLRPFPACVCVGVRARAAVAVCVRALGRVRMHVTKSSATENGLRVGTDLVRAPRAR